MTEKRHLPIASVSGARRSSLFESSLRADGSRAMVHPADVRGRFNTWRHVAFYGLIGLWALLPWITIAGKPAVFLDIPARAFYLFGLSFNAQDLWLLFFGATGFAFSLIALTAMAGRVWCGWACPQTVFLEGVFRKIERIIEGPREQRLRRNGGPLTVNRVARFAVSHVFYAGSSLLIAHIILSYFVSLPAMFQMVRSDPSAHPEAFAWTFGIATVTYVNFAWFREQFCVVMCPYGRLQSVLLDEQSLVVGYDAKRGEPRGKASAKSNGSSAGDCVDCRRCVVVCPTGIDIRNGLQLDCLACTACIDACDDIMDRLDRKRGLVRYDSFAGLQGSPRRFWRPRIWLYAALALVGIAATSLAFSSRRTFEANALRPPGVPYALRGGSIDNAFQIHLTNKQAREESFVLETQSPEFDVALGASSVRLKAMESTRIPVVVHILRERYRRNAVAIVKISNRQGNFQLMRLPLAGPEP
jgi:cytochrome c oxidase accessory protein FixG